GPRSAASTMARDDRPGASATKPMPQASISRVDRGSNGRSSSEGGRRTPAQRGGRWRRSPGRSRDGQGRGGRLRVVVERGGHRCPKAPVEGRARLADAAGGTGNF